MSITQEDVQAWSRDFYKALQSGAGTSVTQRLERAKGQQHNPEFVTVLTEVQDIVGRGYPLSKIMALFPHVFDETLISIIRYGEIFGEVDVVLERYVEHPEDRFKPCAVKPS